MLCKNYFLTKFWKVKNFLAINVSIINQEKSDFVTAEKCVHGKFFLKAVEPQPDHVLI